MREFLVIAGARDLDQVIPVQRQQSIIRQTLVMASEILSGKFQTPSVSFWSRSYTYAGRTNKTNSAAFSPAALNVAMRQKTASRTSEVRVLPGREGSASSGP